MHDSKQPTFLLQDADDDAGLDGGVSSSKETSDGDEDLIMKSVDTIISQQHLLSGVKSRFLIQESDRFIAFTDAGE